LRQQEPAIHYNASRHSYNFDKIVTS
jgi:hypothetical protein